jgi:hypothetical protein
VDIETGLKMEHSYFSNFVKKVTQQKRILLGLLFFLVLAILVLLFSRELPFETSRSWILIPSLLVSVLCTLGAIKLNKRIQFFNQVIQLSNLKNGTIRLKNLNQWQEKLDFYAELDLDRNRWELHVHPPYPYFVPREDLSNFSVGVYFDKNNKPAIITTEKGWLFINSVRTLS